MKRSPVVLIAVGAILLFSFNAYAFSIEQGDGANKGQSNFADPDEQTPPFVLMPDTESASDTSRSSEHSLIGPGTSNLSGPVTQGNQVFMPAITHFQNK
jgi:hypothetical protein